MQVAIRTTENQSTYFLYLFMMQLALKRIFKIKSKPMVKKASLREVIHLNVSPVAVGIISFKKIGRDKMCYFAHGYGCQKTKS